MLYHFVPEQSARFLVCHARRGRLKSLKVFFIASTAISAPLPLRRFLATVQNYDSGRVLVGQGDPDFER
jgi:hypothetical protein